MRNLLIAQSGGPTSAINATLVGIFTAGYLSNKIEKIYGSINGIEGVFKKNIIDLREKIKIPTDLDILSQTPAAALGSCRYKIQKAEELKKVINIFREYNIGYFLYIGGNDSMDTVEKLSKYCKNKKIEDIKIIGIPKTIDNDLEVTDHCPGFGSAAKYIATIFREIERDSKVYSKTGVTIIEVMGRNAGWLTSASILANSEETEGPDFIYLPEVDFSVENFIEDLKNKLKEKKCLIVAISEGIKDKSGKYISEYSRICKQDEFGHKYIAGAGKYLEAVIGEKIGCRVRAIEINLLQRCSAHLQSGTDIKEAKLLGMKGIFGALEGKTGIMVALKRKEGKYYDIDIEYIDISQIANKEKKVPLSWINKQGNFVTNEMEEYLRPLISGEIKNVYDGELLKYITLY